jgi:mannose-6-phosphate isomerase-like protein (cupin superfamily)
MKTPVNRMTLAAATLAACLTACLAAQPLRTAEKTQPLAARVQSFDKVAEERTAWGSLRWLINAKLDPSSGITLGDVTLNPGQSNPLHVHGNSDEVIYVLSGMCEQRVGTETVILKPGDALRIPAGVPHTAKVLGKTPMRAVVVYNTGERQFTPVKEDKATK